MYIAELGRWINFWDVRLMQEIGFTDSQIASVYHVSAETILDIEQRNFHYTQKW